MILNVSFIAYYVCRIQIEMSRDINLIIPVFLAVFVAKMLADLLSKPLHKCQLEAKSMPYLDQEPDVVVNGEMCVMHLYSN